MDIADKETLKMMIIEQEEGFRNIEEIVQVEGVDMVVLGPGDLSVGMGLGGRQDDPRIKEYMDNAAAVCVKYKMPFLAWPAMQKEALKQWADKGASMFGFPQDSFFISQAIMRLWPEYDAALSSKQNTHCE